MKKKIKNNYLLIKEMNKASNEETNFFKEITSDRISSWQVYIQ